MQRVTVLGSTGSIGVNTLDVISRHPERFSVFALTAADSVDALLAQIVVHRPQYAVMANPEAAQRLSERLQHIGCATEVLAGPEGLAEVARHESVDTVVAAIVGAAGLAPTMAAVQSGKKVLLANKEALVMAGALFMRAVAAGNACLMPVDSEHNAIFQCLPPGCRDLRSAGVRRLLLTGSGGPFRTMPLEAIKQVTPEQACAHPNWSMGRKISVDSATMMNKGLEYIEARWLFDAQPDQIEVVVHPQSIVHSMVEFLDGSVLAQLGQPDMRTPIAHCLGWPERLASGVSSLNFWELGPLEFERPDLDRFPCLHLAMQAMQTGATAPAVLNAANEIAVEAFLAGVIAFPDIATLVDRVMQKGDFREPESLDAVILADHEARSLARRLTQAGLSGISVPNEW